MNVLDLFSGIGGFSLGLKRAGMQTTAFCEIDPFCRRVLAKHWPDTPIYDDIRTLTAERLRADGIPVDLICGGFPCQDISIAGKGAGIAGERSGLWGEYARIIGEVRPRYVIVENVAALLGRGLSVVLGDLAALGFDAEWHCIPASAVGAPHRRDRVWIVAYPARDGGGRPRLGIEHGGAGVAGSIGQRTISAQDTTVSNAERDQLRHEQQRLPGRRPRGICHEGQAEPRNDGAARPVSDAHGGGCRCERQSQHGDEQGAPGYQPDRRRAPGRRQGAHVADAECLGCERGALASASRCDEGAREATPRRRTAGRDAAAGRNTEMADADGELGRRSGHASHAEPDDGEEAFRAGEAESGRRSRIVAEPSGPRLSLGPGTLREWAHAATTGEGWWAVEPDVGRVADGPADKVDRRKRLIAIGNSLVPKIPEMIGGAIMEWERAR